MLNEGIITNDTKILMKSEMVKQLQRLERTTPDEWERAVFENFTGQKREDIDWEFEDNQAGYYTWIKSFDQLIQELEEDGYVQVKDLDNNKRIMVARKTDPAIDYSHMVYPSK